MRKESMEVAVAAMTPVVCLRMHIWLMDCAMSNERMEFVSPEITVEEVQS